ncbi:MAG: protein kinase, partial [Planctomycetales bacterium]
KITDLAVARFLGEDDAESVTLQYGEDRIGTLTFMAPEQMADSHNIDAQSDVYALGASMYYLLTGKAPVPPGIKPKMIFLHLDKDPVPLEVLRPDLPEDLVRLCRRMLAKPKEDRFASAEEAGHELRQWILASSQGRTIHQPDGVLGAARDRVESRDDTVVSKDTAILERRSLPSISVLSQEYNDQKFLLEGVYSQNQHDSPPVVADYLRMEHDKGKPLSYCIWREGETALLPCTDLIAFFPQDAVTFQMVKWERAIECVGDLMDPADDLYPARYRVERFPEEDRLIRMNR